MSSPVDIGFDAQMLRGIKNQQTPNNWYPHEIPFISTYSRVASILENAS